MEISSPLLPLHILLLGYGMVFCRLLLFSQLVHVIKLAFLQIFQCGLPLRFPSFPLSNHPLDSPEITTFPLFAFLAWLTALLFNGILPSSAPFFILHRQVRHLKSISQAAIIILIFGLLFFWEDSPQFGISFSHIQPFLTIFLSSSQLLLEKYLGIKFE